MTAKNQHTRKWRCKQVWAPGCRNSFIWLSTGRTSEGWLSKITWFLLYLLAPHWYFYIYRYVCVCKIYTSKHIYAHMYIWGFFQFFPVLPLNTQLNDCKVHCVIENNNYKFLYMPLQYMQNKLMNLIWHDIAINFSWTFNLNVIII